MSTIPLSARGLDAPEGTSPYGPMSPEDRVDAGADARLDAVVTKALERMPDDDAVPTPKSERKSMDTLISEGLDRHEAAQDEKDSFAASRESRRELQERYASQGGEFSKTLDNFIDVARQFKADPQGTGLRAAEAYMRASPYALKPHEPKAKPEAFFVDGKRYNGNVLDSIIEDAMDNASNEKKDFEATPAQRAALKELFPGKTFAEALATVAKIDRDLHIDPLGTAATLAAQFGMPVTPQQQQTHAEKVQAASEVAHAEQRMAHLDQVRHRMSHIIEHDPRFGEAMRQGATSQQVLDAAYQMALQEYQQTAQAVQWTNAQLAEVAKTSEPLARATIDVLDPKHPAFVESIWRIDDPEARLQAAMGVALRQVQNDALAIAKAKRVKPTRSSSGANPGGSGATSGLDAAIANAMKNW
jgi:hypothetical protein